MPVAHRIARAREVRVRPCTDADLPRVRCIIAAAYAPYERMLGPLAFEQYLSDLLDLDRHRQHGEILVAELHGVICGAVAYCPDASRQGVRWPAGWASGRGLAVDSPARGMGVAEALARAVERRAADDGAAALALHTAEFMHGARALYDRLGFRRVPDLDSDLSDYLRSTPTRRLPALAYVLPLAPEADRTSVEYDEDGIAC